MVLDLLWLRLRDVHVWNFECLYIDAIFTISEVVIVSGSDLMTLMLVILTLKLRWEVTQRPS